jgi:hypothetical protein
LRRGVKTNAVCAAASGGVLELARDVPSTPNSLSPDNEGVRTPSRAEAARALLERLYHFVWRSAPVRFAAGAEFSIVSRDDCFTVIGLRIGGDGLLRWTCMEDGSKTYKATEKETRQNKKTFTTNYGV